jgi:hypothetical protein
MMQFDTMELCRLLCFKLVVIASIFSTIQHCAALLSVLISKVRQRCWLGVPAAESARGALSNSSQRFRCSGTILKTHGKYFMAIRFTGALACEEVSFRVAFKNDLPAQQNSLATRVCMLLHTLVGLMHVLWTSFHVTCLRELMNQPFHWTELWKGTEATCRH